jgi:hypothetical protein
MGHSSSEVSATATTEFTRGITETSERVPGLRNLLRLALTYSFISVQASLGCRAVHEWQRFTRVACRGYWIGRDAVFGSKVWPAITVGAFLVNFQSAAPVWSARALLWVAISSAVLADRRFPFQEFGLSGLITAALAGPIAVRGGTRSRRATVPPHSFN